MHAHARGAPGAGLSVHIDATAESRGAAGHRLPRPLARGCGRGAARASGPLARAAVEPARARARLQQPRRRCWTRPPSESAGTPRSDPTKARARAVGQMARAWCGRGVRGCGPGRGERTPARGMEQWSCSCMPASRARASSRAGCVPCPSLDGAWRNTSSSNGLECGDETYTVALSATACVLLARSRGRARLPPSSPCSSVQRSRARRKQHDPVHQFTTS